MFQVLLGILQQRIELDKECMFQFTQLRKEVGMIWMNWKKCLFR